MFGVCANNSRRCLLTAAASQLDSDKNHCRLCARAFGLRHRGRYWPDRSTSYCARPATARLPDTGGNPSRWFNFANSGSKTRANVSKSPGAGTASCRWVIRSPPPPGLPHFHPRVNKLPIVEQFPVTLAACPRAPCFLPRPLSLPSGPPLLPAMSAMSALPVARHILRSDLFLSAMSAPSAARQVPKPCTHDTLSFAASSKVTPLPPRERDRG